MEFSYISVCTQYISVFTIIGFSSRGSGFQWLRLAHLLKPCINRASHSRVAFGIGRSMAVGGAGRALECGAAARGGLRPGHLEPCQTSISKSQTSISKHGLRYRSMDFDIRIWLYRSPQTSISKHFLLTSIKSPILDFNIDVH